MSRPYNSNMSNYPQVGSQRHTSRNPRYSRNIDVHEMLKEEMAKDTTSETNYRIYVSDASANRQPGLAPVSEYSHGITKDSIPAPKKKPSLGNQGETEYAEGGTGASNQTVIPKPVTPYVQAPTDKIERKDIGIKDTYILFNTCQKKVGSNPNEGLYVFDILPRNNDVPIENIIEMELLPFYIDEVETDPSYQPNYYFMRKLRIYFEIIAGKQYINAGDFGQDTGTNRFHFDAEIQNAGINFKIEPLNETYIFGFPVRDLSELRVIFATPYKTVRFEEDCFDVTAVSAVPPPPNADRRFRTSVPHNLPIGSTVSVIFQNFSSTNATLNNIINNPIGHLVDVIDTVTVQLTNTPGANAIGTSVNTSGNPPSAEMIVLERNIQFTVRFRSLQDHLTNYIAP